MGKLIFLDTNIYLHYQPFDQINWYEILKAENVTIVVPPVTVRELNKHKDTHQQVRVKNRAGQVIKKLFKYFETSSYVAIADRLALAHEDREPSIVFEEYHLDRQVQDDILVASAIVAKTENPNDEIIIITSDYGLNLLGKARRLEIQTLMLSERLKLPEDINTEQKEIKRLEEELLRIKSKTPKISLVFSNEGQHVAFDVEKPINLTKEIVDEEIEKLKLLHPKLETQNDQHESAGIPLGLFLSISKGDIEQYNNDLEIYFENYRKYLSYKFDYQNKVKRTLELEIVVSNNGAAPADDIDVFMHFPDGFELIEKYAFPELSDPPRPPSKPQTQLEKITQMSSLVSMPYISAPGINLGSDLASNVSSHNIKRTKSYEVDFQIQRLKQKVSVPTDILCLVFNSYESAQSFQIDYRIIVADPPCEFSGDLHVVVNKQ